MNFISNNLNDVYNGNASIDSIYKGKDLIWRKIVKLRDVLTLKIKIDNDGGGFYIPLYYYSNSTLPVSKIDWGDGTISTNYELYKSSSSSKKQKIYEKAGEYIVKFYTPEDADKNYTLTISSSTCADKLTDIISFGETLYYGLTLNGCTNNLPKIPPMNLLGGSITVKTVGAGTPYNGINGVSEWYDNGYLPLDVTGVYARLDKPFTLLDLRYTDLIGDPFEGYTGTTASIGNIIYGGDIGTVYKMTIPDSVTSCKIGYTTRIFEIRELTLSKLIYNVNNCFYESSSTKSAAAIREMYITNIGAYEGSNAMNFSNFLNWGLESHKTSIGSGTGSPLRTSPNARLSLIKTLVTSSKDLSKEGRTLKISLSANTKAVLTDEEIAQITAKGYTIA